MMAMPIAVQQVDAGLDFLGALPQTAAEPVRATVTVWPHFLVMHWDGVERATVCRGKVDVVDFYRRDEQ